MAELTVQGFETEGTDISFSSAAQDDYFKNGGNTDGYGKVLFIVDNTDSSSHDVTFVTQKTVDGENVNDKTVTVPANTERIFGPFLRDVYNDSNNEIQLDYSSTTGMNVAAIRPSRF